MPLSLLCSFWLFDLFRLARFGSAHAQLLVLQLFGHFNPLFLYIREINSISIQILKAINWSLLMNNWVWINRIAEKSCFNISRFAIIMCFYAHFLYPIAVYNVLLLFLLCIWILINSIGLIPAELIGLRFWMICIIIFVSVCLIVAAKRRADTIPFEVARISTLLCKKISPEYKLLHGNWRWISMKQLKKRRIIWINICSEDNISLNIFMYVIVLLSIATI